MLTIRLARTGRTKYPTYRIVAAESARAATGKFVAVLGHYNPHTKELVMNTEAIKDRLSHGAQPSNTVVKLLMREKVELPKWVTLKTKVKPEAPAAEAKTDEPTEAEVEAAEATPAEAPQEEVRVGELNEEAASAAEADAPTIDGTDTAETEAKAAGK